MLMLGKKPVSPLCMPYAGIEKATNCLLEVPQNLKLELNGNVLTIKKGSVGVVCTSTYTTVTVANDVTLTLSQADGTYVIFLIGSGSGLVATPINKVSSGSSLPETGLNGDRFFNTTDTHMYYHNESEWLASILCYPVCLIQITSGVASFAKDDNGNNIIFNDFSIIGHHYIGYPNNNLALGCNGFNTDGSYKTTYIHRNALYIFELPKTYVSFVLKPNGTLFGGGYNPLSQLPYEEVNELQTTYVAANIYVKDENQIYRWSDNLSEYQIQNGSLYYGYINLSSDGIFKNMAIQQPLTKYRWVVKLIP